MARETCIIFGTPETVMSMLQQEIIAGSLSETPTFLWDHDDNKVYVSVCWRTVSRGKKEIVRMTSDPKEVTFTGGAGTFYKVNGSKYFCYIPTLNRSVWFSVI